MTDTYVTTGKPFIRWAPAPGAYVRGWRAILAGEQQVVMERFGEPLTRQHMWRALERRINYRAQPYEPSWRKLTYDYQRHLLQDCLAIRNLLQHRIHPSWNRFTTPELQARYGHLLQRD